MLGTTMLKVEVLLSSTSPSSSEELIEHIFVTEMAMSRGITSLLLPLDTFFSMLIVDPPLFRITESLIGISYGLELFLGTVWVILVLIGMELDGHLLESLLDLIFRRSTLQS
jgi:hypothetical protein